MPCARVQFKSIKQINYIKKRMKLKPNTFTNLRSVRVGPTDFFKTFPRIKLYADFIENCERPQKI